jgi:hypothetical protein
LKNQIEAKKVISANEIGKEIGIHQTDGSVAKILHGDGLW